MTGRKMVGISNANSVFAGQGFQGLDFSTDTSNVPMTGEKLTPTNPIDMDLKQGATDGSSIQTSMPKDLQGPNGWNMPTGLYGAQNIITDVNGSPGTDGGVNPQMIPFDAPAKSPPSPSANNTGTGGIKQGINLDAQKAQKYSPQP